MKKTFVQEGINNSVIIFKKNLIPSKCSCGGLNYNVVAYRKEKDKKIKGFSNNIKGNIYNLEKGNFCIKCGDVSGSFDNYGIINYTNEIRKAWLNRKEQ